MFTPSPVNASDKNVSIGHDKLTPQAPLNSSFVRRLQKQEDDESESQTAVGSEVRATNVGLITVWKSNVTHRQYCIRPMRYEINTNYIVNDHYSLQRSMLIVSATVRLSDLRETCNTHIGLCSTSLCAILYSVDVAAMTRQALINNNYKKAQLTQRERATAVHV